jgi:hypothetical protein
MEKVEKTFDNGEVFVAVLISYGYGAGWSSWNGDYDEEMLFDPYIANLIIEDKFNYKEVEEYCEEKYPEAYLGGLSDLYVVWIPKGTQFRISEYDGYESVELLDKTSWLTA